MSFLSSFPVFKNLLRLELKDSAAPGLAMSRASAGIYFKKKIFTNAAVNEPRFDLGSFSDTNEGLLIESAATNVIPNSWSAGTLDIAPHADYLARGVSDYFGGTGAVRIGVAYPGNTPSMPEVSAGYEGAISMAAGERAHGVMFFKPYSAAPFTLHANLMLQYAAGFSYAVSVAVNQTHTDANLGSVRSKKMANGWWRVDYTVVAAQAASRFRIHLHFFRRTVAGAMDYFDVFHPSFGKGERNSIVYTGASAATRAQEMATHSTTVSGNNLLIQSSFIPVAIGCDVLTLSNGTTPFSIHFNGSQIVPKVGTTLLSSAAIAVGGASPHVKDLLVLFDQSAKTVTMKLGGVTTNAAIPANTSILSGNATLKLGSNVGHYSAVFEKVHVYEGGFTSTHIERLGKMLAA